SRRGGPLLAREDEGALAAVVRPGGDGGALVVLTLRLADAHLPRAEVHLRAVQVALAEQVDELAGADGLDDQLVGGLAAGLAAQLHLDVRRAVVGHVARLDAADALRL